MTATIYLHRLEGVSFYWIDDTYRNQVRKLTESEMIEHESKLSFTPEKLYPRKG